MSTGVNGDEFLPPPGDTEADSHPLQEYEPMEFHDPPAGGLGTPDAKLLSHTDKMRSSLAIALIVITIAIVGLGFLGWIRGHDLGAWATFTAPVFTLLGVALTFYFTKDPGA